MPIYGFTQGTRHLIALREDSEVQQAVPETDAEPLDHTNTTMKRTFEAESESLPLTSGSLLQSFPELLEMTLCVDTSSLWFDVEQAHLSFERQAESSDSSMPSLRGMVHPKEWETLRRKLKHVAQGGTAEIMPMTLLDDAKRRLIAQVRVSAYRPPCGSDGVKLCLNFFDLIFEHLRSVETE